MISQKILVQLKKLLESSTNPLFLFDNDPDGICSTAILLRNIKKGKGLVLKSIDKISEKFQKKILSNYPSDVFIIDKPIKDEDFFYKLSSKSINVICIDHHEQKEIAYCLYFNSYPSSEPTSYITQKVFDSEETRFLSLIGCISDFYIPDFFEDEAKKYVELFPAKKDIFDILYSSDFGKCIQILSLSLMNSDANISKILDVLVKIKSPYDLLIESKENSFMHDKYNELKKFIDTALSKTHVFERLVYLESSGKHSLSSEIANRLLFLYRDKFVIVCCKKEGFVNVSLRGENAKKFVEKVIKKIENSIGGGHEKACGLRFPISSYDTFKKIVSDNFSISF
ncbi:MAG: DHH family phosphoesterase [Candidatus Pacearchaeota archaeon]